MLQKDVSRREVFFKQLDDIFPSWNMFWGRFRRDYVFLETFFRTSRCHWKTYQDEKYTSKHLVNEKSSSNDLSRRGIVIKRFICTRSHLRKICQEKDLSSEYLSRRGVTSFKRFCRKRIVFEWFIKMVGCHQTYFQDVEMSLKDFPKRGFVIERFIKTRNYLQKSFEDG